MPNGLLFDSVVSGAYTDGSPRVTQGHQADLKSSTGNSLVRRRRKQNVAVSPSPNVAKNSIPQAGGASGLNDTSTAVGPSRGTRRSPSFEYGVAYYPTGANSRDVRRLQSQQVGPKGESLPTVSGANYLREQHRERGPKGGGGMYPDSPLAEENPRGKTPKNRVENLLRA